MRNIAGSIASFGPNGAIAWSVGTSAVGELAFWRMVLRTSAIPYLARMRAGSSLTSPSIASQMELKAMPMAHSMFHGNACFALFNNTWDIASECTRY